MSPKPSIASMVAECLKNPRRRSVWIPRLGRYVCPETEDGQTAIEQEGSPRDGVTASLHPQFKLVFLTAAGGTLLFLLLCVTLTLVSGREPPPLLEKVAVSCFDLAKIGFGAIVGLLGGQRLQVPALKDTA